MATGTAPAAGAATHHSRSVTETRMAAAVFAQLNSERRAHHLPPLHSSTSLRASARTHDEAMARADVLSHQLRAEAVFTTRMTRAGYRWSWAGENIGYNSDMSTRGAKYLETSMLDERPPADGHRRNILSTHFRDVGVDVYRDVAHHRLWLTTDFGAR